MTDRLTELADLGVAIWLDDLSRERLESGNLADLVKESGVVGVTTNPTIFESSVSRGPRRFVIESTAPIASTPASCSASAPGPMTHQGIPVSGRPPACSAERKNVPWMIPDTTMCVV